MIGFLRKKQKPAMLGLALTMALSTAAVPLASPAEADTLPWMDKALSAEERANLLVDKMTLEDKVDFITGNLNNYYGFYNGGVEKYGIPALTMADGPVGVRIANPDVQDKKSTAMPAAIGLAATWNTETAEKYGDLLGDEAFNTTHNVLLGPGLDIARNAFGSRNFESLGEDPYLQSQMATEYVKAVQSNNVLVTAKHYLLNNQELNRFVSDSQASERAINEIYAKPFASVIKDAEMGSVMCSFNKVNGVYACDNEEILTNLLRDKLGFEGFVMSDYRANVSTSNSIKAGMDLETPGDPGGLWGDKLVQAVHNGEVSEETIDQSTYRILYQMFDKGLFDNPAQNNKIDAKAHGAIARQIAAESMVLLQNDDKALPLDTDKLDSIAVIGPDADNASTAGGGSSLVNPTYTVSPLEGIKNRAGKDLKVEYAAGTDPISAGDLLPGPNAVPSSFLAPSADSEENGLKAEYWSNAKMEGNPVYEHTAKQANLHLGFYNYEGFNAQSTKLDKLPTSLNSMMSARYTGVIQVPKSGEYKLSTSSYGSSKVYLDGKLVIDNTGETFGTVEKTVTLNANQKYDLKIEYKTDYPYNPGRDNGAKLRFGWEAADDVVDENIKKAVELAKKSDAAVIVTKTYDSEGNIDRSDMELPNNQEQLIKEVAKVNKHVVVVNESGMAVEMGDWKDSVDSIVQAWYPGQEQGNAIADVLFGDVNPSGKLPVTFPVDEDKTPVSSDEQYPGVNDVSKYSEGIFVGYRGFEEYGIKPAFSFGHGLSYTEFGYKNLKTKVQSSGKNKETTFEVSLNVRNTGDKAGSEVVQVYTGKLPTDVETAPKQLAGFQKIKLEPGKQQRVTIQLDSKALSYYDEEKHDWVMPSGSVPVYVGSSSTDIRLTGSIKVPANQ
ncbi:glycoside hydrolase family 3 C-terminal domain-containing protein [Domibacillus sp. DTU_2020_1001157_1_SI_ALB_TIR_016]|uniref:glycoside hydrolase family 3 C-terminal domain-containing protein n=1 Tax=Domibacillus sp. DTU_2020_1001157_1_SI_ALB_TIR_016 TaxID=3077789 RepID=UPI0028E35C12|nr:glycoside hydrolase family 3 C-terminal domain-containing protein [Domibacillus sp. DTU_2020_1001157_1_SI_ALB_TIR_016]WNS77705.1 glycoside hydrolase family 3 C-terminal domain-containing protein [Domibacillus sp. DTU_2020_1001157_1_SI_ALB_TIR_016]